MNITVKVQIETDGKSCGSCEYATNGGNRCKLFLEYLEYPPTIPEGGNGPTLRCGKCLEAEATSIHTHAQPVLFS